MLQAIVGALVRGKVLAWGCALCMHHLLDMPSVERTMPILPGSALSIMITTGNEAK